MPDALTSAAWARVQKTRGTITQLHRDLKEALSEATNFHDPHLNADGLAAKRQELKDRARETYAAKIEGLREQLERDTSVLQAEADRAGPSLGDDPASLMRAQMKWDQTRMKLEAGIPLRRVIDDAQADALLALREWAPTWLAAQQHQSADHSLMGAMAATGPDVDGIIAAIDGRLSQVAGGDYGTVLSWARGAAAEGAYAAPMLEHFTGVLNGTPEGKDALGAAIAARMAADESTGDLAVASADVGQSEETDAP